MISNLKISGFRGVPDEREFEFARITLLAGRNGLGKTTVFDAIDWCLFGESWRLAGQDTSLRNLYSQFNRPCVTVTATLFGKPVTIERTEQWVKVDGQPVSERELLTHLATDLDLFPPYSRDIATRIRETVYLPQTDIRKIVSPESNEERAALFQALLGVPNAALLQSSFRKVQDRIEAKKRSLEDQRSELRQRIEELLAASEAAAPVARRRRQQVVSRTVRLLDGIPSDATSPEESLSASRTQLQALGSKRVEMEGFQAFLAEFETSLEGARRAIQEGDERVGALTEEFALADRRLSEALIEREQSEKQSQRKSAELTPRVFRLEELKTATALLTNQTAAVRSSEETLAKANEALSSARDSSQSSRNTLERHRVALDQAISRSERAQRLDHVSAQRATITHALSENQRRSHELEDKIAELETNLVAAEAEF
jgi:exonuclease SbcC